MRRRFYHTDLGQNVVFHNFAIQIALIHYLGRSKHAWAFSETVKKKFSKITYTASRFSNSWKTNQAGFFAFDKFTLQNLANKSGDV